MKKLNKLIEISSPIAESCDSKLSREIKELYSDINGFIAFEGALLCLPIGIDADIEIMKFNTNRSWKAAYSEGVQDTLFFAADIFCHLFGLYKGGIVKFNPESGILEKHSSNIEEWASLILSDYDYETGWSLAKNWQLENRLINIGERLLPKVPFSIGGEYEVSNLTDIDLNEAMNQYSKLFAQVKNIEKGEAVKIYSWLEF